MELKNKTAIVTGGASGLGMATVRALHGKGVRVVVADINQERGQSLTKELGKNALFVKMDITDTIDIEKMVSQACDKFEAIHILVNCAGTGFPSRLINKVQPHDIEVFRKLIAVNLTGSFDVMRLAAFEMQRNRPVNPEGERGVIINTASAAAYDGQIGQTAYAASKAGLVGLTLPAARDLSVCGIRVCTIAPGSFDTPLLQLAPDNIKTALLEQQPFPKRFGRPEEYAMLVQQIVENPMLNGETIRLDGAMRMGPR